MRPAKHWVVHSDAVILVVLRQLEGALVVDLPYYIVVVYLLYADRIYINLIMKVTLLAHFFRMPVALGRSVTCRRDFGLLRWGEHMAPLNLLSLRLSSWCTCCGALSQQVCKRVLRSLRPFILLVLRCRIYRSPANGAHLNLADDTGCFEPPRASLLRVMLLGQTLEALKVLISVH